METGTEKEIDWDRDTGKDRDNETDRDWKSYKDRIRNARKKEKSKTEAKTKIWRRIYECDVFSWLYHDERFWEFHWIINDVGTRIDVVGFRGSQPGRVSKIGDVNQVVSCTVGQNQVDLKHPIIQFSTSLEVSEWGVRKRVNGRASGPVLLSRFLALLNHCVLLESLEIYA